MTSTTNKSTGRGLIYSSIVISLLIVFSVYYFANEQAGLGTNSSTSVDFFIGVIIAILGFVIIRNIILWYWKIDKAIELLEKIEENTRTK